MSRRHTPFRKTVFNALRKKFGIKLSQFYGSWALRKCDSATHRCFMLHDGLLHHVCCLTWTADPQFVAIDTCIAHVHLGTGVLAMCRIGYVVTPFSLTHSLCTFFHLLKNVPIQKHCFQEEHNVHSRFSAPECWCLGAAGEPPELGRTPLHWRTKWVLIHY